MLLHTLDVMQVKRETEDNLIKEENNNDNPSKFDRDDIETNLHSCYYILVVDVINCLFSMAKHPVCIY